MTAAPYEKNRSNPFRLRTDSESDLRERNRAPSGNGDVDRNRLIREPNRRRVAVLGTPATIIEALAVALNAPHDLEAVGVASNEEEMCRVVEVHQPDVVVVYASHIEKDMLESITRLRRAANTLRVVILSEQPTVPMLAHAAAAGVVACLPLDIGLRDLIGAVRADTTAAILVGASSLAARNREADRALADNAAVTLTRRELEVLALLAEGLSPSVIAKRLFVSVYTARGHVKNVLRKLGAHSQLEAVAIASRVGLMPWRDPPNSQVAP